MAWVKLNGIEVPALIVDDSGEATSSGSYRPAIITQGVFSNAKRFYKGWQGKVIGNAGVADFFIAFEPVNGDKFDYSLDEKTIFRLTCDGDNGVLNCSYHIIYNGVETFTQRFFPTSGYYSPYLAFVPLVISPGIEDGSQTAEIGFSFLFFYPFRDAGYTHIGEFIKNVENIIKDSIGISISSGLGGAYKIACPIMMYTAEGSVIKGYCGFTYTEYPDAYNTDDAPPPPPPNDPYNPGGTTEPGGGGGTYQEKSDPIEIPSLPAISSADTGLITLFNPSLNQLQQLGNYLWSDLFDVATWKKLFADPMDAILGLSIVPVAVPNEGASPIKVGNIATDVLANKATSQFVEVDCGSIAVEEFWGAYLDYDPFTKAEIYLPYIGTHPLTTDDVMGKTVRVVYHVDVLSGACCAYIKCGESVLYSFVGQCSCSIPITGNDWTNVINGALNIAASIGTMVATGGASAPMALTDIASTAVNSMKPSVEKSGSISGMGGIMGLQRPYLILTRPRQAVPKNQNRYSGYPSFITRKLSDITGYTEVDSIHLENIPATEQELSEIESLLKGGVLL